MVRTPRHLLAWLGAPLALALALGLGGCVELDQHLTLEAEGGGTLRIELCYDADVLRRGLEALDDRTPTWLLQHPLPLRLPVLRDSLAGLPGLTLEEATEDVDERGWRRLRLRIRFDRLANLVRWEVAARWSLALEVPTPPGPAAEGVSDLPPHRLRWSPAAFVPVLDPIATLRRDLARPALPGEPTPLERRKLSKQRFPLLAKMLSTRLAKVQLRYALTVPGPVDGVQAGEPDGDNTVRLTLGPAAFDGSPKDPGSAPRDLAITFHPLAFAIVRPVAHVGERRTPGAR